MSTSHIESKQAAAGADVSPSSVAEQLLIRSQGARPVVQELVALPDSLEWERILPPLSGDVVPFTT